MLDRIRLSEMRWRRNERTFHCVCSLCASSKVMLSLSSGYIQYNVEIHQTLIVQLSIVISNFKMYHWRLHRQYRKNPHKHHTHRVLLFLPRRTVPLVCRRLGKLWSDSDKRSQSVPKEYISVLFCRRDESLSSLAVDGTKTNAKGTNRCPTSPTTTISILTRHCTWTNRWLLFCLTFVLYRHGASLCSSNGSDAGF